MFHAAGCNCAADATAMPCPALGTVTIRFSQCAVTNPYWTVPAGYRAPDIHEEFERASAKTEAIRAAFEAAMAPAEPASLRSLAGPRGPRWREHAHQRRHPGRDRMLRQEAMA